MVVTPDVSFAFGFADVVANVNIPVGGQMVAVPLKNAGAVGPTAADTANVDVRRTYQVTMKGGDSNQRPRGDSGVVLRKPVDNIGTKSFPNYATYAADHIYAVEIPGCGA